MTSKTQIQNTHTLTDQPIVTDTSSPTTASLPTLTGIDALIEAQVTFMQEWLRTRSEALSLEAWQWLGAQPMSRYVSCDDVQRLLSDWLLSHPMSDQMRADIRDILRTIIYHPANDNMPLSELIDDTQVEILASYISRHEQQRNALIHTVVGNETFADLLTQTLYHAINDFMESTLDKAGGVGKLMKMGRSSFEKATNRNLDDKLQAYLHRNIKDLTRRAEANAQSHLSNEEVTRLLVTGWARLKDLPVSELQTYLNDEPDNSSIDHIEKSLQHSYNRLRLSPYLRSLASACAQTWYQNHQADTIAQIGASLAIDARAIEQMSAALRPLMIDAIDSDWLSTHIREMLTEFYQQPAIKDNIRFEHV